MWTLGYRYPKLGYSHKSPVWTSLMSLFWCPTGKVVCQGRSPNEEKVLLGCEDGSLALYDEYKKTTHITNAKLVRDCAVLKQLNSFFSLTASYKNSFTVLQVDQDELSSLL